MRSGPVDFNDMIPAPLRAVVELFEGPLADVSFPGVDREGLLAATEAVAGRASAVDDARRRLDEAQAQMDAELDRFRHLARRAIAYAEIYADGDPALAEQLAAIELDGDARKTGTKPTRRRRKKAPEPELPLGPQGEDSAVEVAA